MPTFHQVKNGFTLLEIMLVVVIIGVLASFTLSRFSTVVERNTSSEGTSILTALLGAQKRYQLENGSYTNNLNNLDLTIPTSKNFNAPTVATSNPIATIQRNTTSFTLFIDSSGNITCQPSAAICKKMGY